ncbi:MAG TPA: choice-of-anchor Q domain-containing protein [Rudaea sp.]|nr:choice-of-anchor Q domain-containing protein [Rudaea sp.]
MADHGGPTRTDALLADGPAIDHGNHSPSSGTDQRGAGFDRSAGTTADFGACERPSVDDEVRADGFD